MSAGLRGQGSPAGWAFLRDMETVSLSDQPAPAAWSISPALSDVLLNPRPRGFHSFAVVPSNVRAVEGGLLFANGLVTQLAIVGPSGWGKTHLLEAIAHHLSAERGPRSYEIWSAADWVVASRTRTSNQALILDNVQDALSKPRSRQQLRLALERRVKAGWPTALSFTESRITRTIRAALPAFREWSLVAVRPPDIEEREVVVNHIAQSEGIVLALELRRILAQRLEGNGRTLIGAFKRLKLNGAKWATSEDVLRACGILNPFFASNSAWDLRDHIVEVANNLPEGSVNPPSDLAVYSMLKIAQLCEVDVARYFEVEPAKAYATAQRVSGSIRQNAEAWKEVQTFVGSIVTALQNT